MCIYNVTLINAATYVLIVNFYVVTTKKNVSEGMVPSRILFFCRNHL